MSCDPHFHWLLDAVPVRLWYTGPEGEEVYFNRAWQDLFGEAYEPIVPIIRCFGMHPDDAGDICQLFGQLIAAREPVKLEFRLRRRDGIWRWMLCSGQPRAAEDGEFAGFIGSCIDITDRHEAEAQQQRELAEKAAVMQELHHRVKNNAQVFASLLSVQANRARDPAVKAALRVAAARASTMAMTQQQIWDAGSSARFDLVGLVQRLVRAHQSPDVTIVLDAPPNLFVPLATAVPLGLILHELLANARHHAFPERTDGMIEVSARRTGPTLSLMVMDNGIGMPAQRDPSSAGLTIVRSLVRQLDAQLTTETVPGTRVMLTMHCPPP